MNRAILLSLILVIVSLVACSQENESAPATPTAESLAGEALSSTVERAEATATPAAIATATAPVVATVEDSGEQQQATPSPTASLLPEPTATPTESQSRGEPIEVTYFTPSQTEGPYYPVNKLDDRDNDLTSVDGAGGAPAGQIVEFGGVVYDANGVPQPGITVEIWQTDASGIYLHPNDPGTNQRDPNFQFYGESVTDAAGQYSFRTILPGRYEPRPRHIHVKVKLNGQELLITQFYFADDPELAGEAMLAQVGQDGQQLIITLDEALDEEDQSILTGRRNIVLSLDLSS